MAKVKVWKRPDGSVAVTHFNFNMKREDETDEQFMKRVTDKLKHEHPEFVGYEEHEKESSDLPDRAQRSKWRMQANGKLEVDNSIELPEEARARILASAKAKLKAGQPLTEEEANFLIGNS
jgi:hypothetical protein